MVVVLGVDQYHSGLWLAALGCARPAKADEQVLHHGRDAVLGRHARLARGPHVPDLGQKWLEDPDHEVHGPDTELPALSQDLVDVGRISRETDVFEPVVEIDDARQRANIGFARGWRALEGRTRRCCG